MAISREMTKRGFSTSKSADSRTGDECDLPEVGSLSLSPPQVYGQRKKLNDLKIDNNFVPTKNKMRKSISCLPSPDGKPTSRQPRIRITSTYLANVSK